MNPFKLKRKVYYDDTDAGGVVYHANYVKYLDHARCEFLSQFGLEMEGMAKNEGVVFAVVKIDVQFKAPARLSDQLLITAKLCNVRGTSMQFEQTVLRDNPGDADPLLLANAGVKVVCLEVASFTPCPIPDSIREKVSCHVD